MKKMLALTRGFQLTGSVTECVKSRRGQGYLLLSETILATKKGPSAGRSIVTCPFVTL